MKARVGSFVLGLLVGSLVTVLVFTCIRGNRRWWSPPAELLDQDVRATTLPHSVDLRYGELTLTQIRREGQFGSRMVASFSLTESGGQRLKGGATLDLGDTRIAASGATSTVCDYRSVNRTRSGTLEAEKWLPISRGQTATIIQDVYIRRPSKEAVFRFDNFTPSDLPITRSFGRAKVTLVSVRTGPLVRPGGPSMLEGWSSGAPNPGDPCIMIAVRSQLPEGFCCVDTPTGPAVYRVDDDKGVCHEALRTYYDHGDVIQAGSFGSGGGISTPSGKLVTVHDYLVFQPFESKRFTIEISGRLPADPRDTASVTFRDVPLP